MRTFIFTILFATFALAVVQAQTEKLSPATVGEGTLLGISKPLRDIPAMTAEEYEAQVARAEQKLLNPKLRTRSYPFAETALPKGPDQVWQKNMGGNKSAASDPIVNFQGQNSPYYPPDDNGTVGPNHYMQTVNTTYAIYSKTGTLIAGPTNMNQLFGSVPGASCNDGDPIILYDEMADRWMAAEFSLCQNPDRMLIAISTTNDPTGTWYQYSFNMSGMPDYEKFGIWPDGYYMGTNTTGGSDIYVFERNVMLTGGTNPKMISFDNQWRPTSIDGFMMVPPLDNDGAAAPAGAPGTFIAFNDDAIGGGSDQLWIYELHADWTTTSNSTFQRTQQIDVAPFDANFGNNWNNIKQPNTSQELDGIPQVIMNVPQYRNFGSYQTIVCCHTVDVDATDHAGIRWYELHKTTGNWSVRQQGTYAPDGNSRWMGSVVMNGNNEIGVGYSISSTSVFPGIRFAGQTAEEYANASGILDVPEGVIWTGTASQTGANRWGDYSLISIDPTDDDTFWYTNQFVSGGQKTRIASFSIGPLGPNPNFVANNTLPCINETVNFTDQSTGSPTAWSWTFTPNTVTFVNGTSASSQNPRVQFNAFGNYNVTLSATNAAGTNIETKTSYISVNQANAEFTAAPLNIVVNNPTTFTDASSCDVTSWQWDFGADATPATASTQGPHSVVYSTTGPKTITLMVNGNSAITKTDYINVISDVFVMNTSTITTCSGTFFDPGGPSGNYGNNQNYTMVFTSSLPNHQLNLNFTEFALEPSTNCANDYIRIYNGLTPFAPLLGTWCGTDIPGSVTSDNASGSLCVVFHSNNSSNAPGWAATVSCLSVVEDPLTVNAMAMSDTQIDVSWNKNQNGNDVLLLWSADGTFGTPVAGNVYNVGDPVTGGGTVLYKGQLTLYNHTGLNASTTYYYKAFSVDADLNYSNGVPSQATTNAAPPTLAVQPLNQDVTANAGNTSFDVTSNTSWTVVSDATWCVPTAAGSGTGSIIAAYESNDMAVERTATLTVTVTGLNPVEVTVTQAAAAPTLAVTPGNYDVSTAAGNVAFAVNSNANWTAETVSTWCTVTPSGTGMGTISADYQENTWAAERTATINVTVDGLDPVVVTVTQAAAVAQIALDPLSQDVTAPAGMAQLTVTANCDWTSSADVNWVSMPASGSGNAVIDIAYNENTAFAPRSALITISGPGVFQSSTLNQAAAVASVAVTPDNINVNYLEGSVQFNVIANTNWTASADSAWLTVTPSGSQSGLLSAAFTQNPYYAQRISTITVSADGVESQLVTVTQSSSEVSIEDPDNQGLRLFPNPTSGAVVLEVDAARYPMLDVTITDMAGHSVVTRKCSGSKRFDFDLKALNHGTYTMHISTGNQTFNRKLVIIK